MDNIAGEIKLLGIPAMEHGVLKPSLMYWSSSFMTLLIKLVGYVSTRQLPILADCRVQMLDLAEDSKVFYLSLLVGDTFLNCIILQSKFLLAKHKLQRISSKCFKKNGVTYRIR